MGFAKVLGRDYGTPQSKQLMALEGFWYWLIGGLPLLFFLSILIFPEPNFVVPIVAYIIGSIGLFAGYLRTEREGAKK